MKDINNFNTNPAITISSGTMTITNPSYQNYTNGFWCYNCGCFHYYDTFYTCKPFTYYYPTIQTQRFDLQIRKVENGWLLVKNGKEYIISDPKEIVKYLKEEK